MALLDGLDSVPWDRVTHAYGPATDVPDLLRALANPGDAAEAIVEKAKDAKRSVRQHVIWELWGNVFHQGTRWQASPHVVPFIAEVLRDGPRDVELRRFLVSYLSHLALGYPADAFPAQIDPKVDLVTTPPGEESDGPFGDSTLRRAAIESYLAVEQFVPDVLPLVNHDDSELALEALALVAWFPREAGRCAPVVRRLLTGLSATRPEDAQRLGSVLLCLARLEGTAAQADAERLVSAEPRLLAIHAACASVLANETGVSDGAIRVLSAPLDDLCDHPTPFTETVGALVGRCLARLPDGHRQRAIVALANNLASAETTTNLSMTGSLLQLAFGSGPAPSRAADLTPLQRVALEGIRDHGGFMLRGMSFGNYALLLGNWKLPRTAAALAKWLHETA